MITIDLKQRKDLQWFYNWLKKRILPRFLKFIHLYSKYSDHFWMRDTVSGKLFWTCPPLYRAISLDCCKGPWQNRWLCLCFPLPGSRAYQWCCELSVYLRPEVRGRDLGRTLYSALMDLLTLQGYYTVYGVITLPNEASIALHNQLGFSVDGIQENCGFKLGSWHNTAIMSKALQNYVPPRFEPKSIHELSSDVINAILSKGPLH